VNFAILFPFGFRLARRLAWLFLANNSGIGGDQQRQHGKNKAKPQYFAAVHDLKAFC
jgi:hypothetical protein